MCRRFKNKKINKYANAEQIRTKYSRRRLYQYNEDDFRVQFWFIKPLNSMKAQTNGNKKNLLMKKASLVIPRKLVILKT